MKRAWFVMELVFAFAAAMLVITACIHFIPKAKEHDIWDIATAIGTVGSAVGAVWIASAESRRRNRTETRIAELTASGMVFRITHDKAIIQNGCKWLEESKFLDRSRSAYRDLLHDLSQICQWNALELLPLTAIPGNAASDLAASSDHVRVCVGAIAGIVDNWDRWHENDAKQDSTDNMLIFLRSSLKYVERAEGQLLTIGSKLENFDDESIL